MTHDCPACHVEMDRQGNHVLCPECHVSLNLDQGDVDPDESVRLRYIQVEEIDQRIRPWLSDVDVSDLVNPNFERWVRPIEGGYVEARKLHGAVDNETIISTLRFRDRIREAHEVTVHPIDEYPGELG